MILSGTIINSLIKEELCRAVAGLPRPPRLAVMRVGNDRESAKFIERKKEFGAAIGAVVDVRSIDQDAERVQTLQMLDKLNEDREVDGIIVQLPKGGDRLGLTDAIYSHKDVDGLGADNFKKFIENRNDAFIPATAKGIVTMLDYYKIPIEGSRVVVVGRSLLAGKSIALALLNRNATVTLAHSKTVDLPAVTKEAHILISAVGRAGLIKEAHVASDQVVIDVGITIDGVESKKMLGDVDYEAVAPLVGAISPVPGGVGPMTVASLFENLIIAFDKNTKFQS